MSPLSGKSAIITGASRGIGLGIAKALAREGVRLGLLSRSKPNVAGEFVACDLIKGTYLGERLKGQPMINPEDIAEMVIFLLQQPDNIDLAEVVVRRFDPKLK